VTTPSLRSRSFPSSPRLALLCAGVLLCVDAPARKPRASRPASAPTTAQILAPSSATVPDALPIDRVVYRCGNSYSPRPCVDAQKPLDVADARSEAQRRQSADVTARSQRLAAWYEAARHQREKAPSAPASARPASVVVACTSTTMMTCVPKKPRQRTLPVSGGGKARPGKAKT